MPRLSQSPTGTLGSFSPTLKAERVHALRNPHWKLLAESLTQVGGLRCEASDCLRAVE